MSWEMVLKSPTSRGAIRLIQLRMKNNMNIYLQMMI